MSMNIYAPTGTQVRYTGSSKEQARWAGCDDPRDLLDERTAYTVEATEVHSFHTKVKLLGHDGWFNSVCFEEAK